MATAKDFFSGMGSGGGGCGGDDEDEEFEVKRRVCVRNGRVYLCVKLRLGFVIGEEKGREIEERGGAMEEEEEEEEESVSSDFNCRRRFLCLSPMGFILIQFKL